METEIAIEFNNTTSEIADKLKRIQNEILDISILIGKNSIFKD